MGSVFKWETLADFLFLNENAINIGLCVNACESFFFKHGMCTTNLYNFSFHAGWHHSAGKGPYTLCTIFSCLPIVALKTVLLLVCLNSGHLQSYRMEHKPLSFSTSLSFGHSVLWCSDLSMFVEFLKPLNTLALSSCGPVVSALLAFSFRLSLALSCRRSTVSAAKDCAWPCASQGIPSHTSLFATGLLVRLEVVILLAPLS